MRKSCQSSQGGFALSALNETGSSFNWTLVCKRNGIKGKTEWWSSHRTVLYFMAGYCARFLIHGLLCRVQSTDLSRAARVKSREEREQASCTVPIQPWMGCPQDDTSSVLSHIVLGTALVMLSGRVRLSHNVCPHPTQLFFRELQYREHYNTLTCTPQLKSNQ